jgi:hypothetical protein
MRNLNGDFWIATGMGDEVIGGFGGRFCGGVRGGFCSMVGDGLTGTSSGKEAVAKFGFDLV